jgi:glycosyltransferase involved in cell wall biosynthesis
MKALAYLANQFPSAVEPYVGAEIAALRKNGFRVLACTARRPETETQNTSGELFCLQDFSLRLALHTVWLAIRSFRQLSSTYRRMLLGGNERLSQRGKALLHTALGFYLAAALKQHKIDHIHVHHGYFSAWIAMVAAQTIGITYSMTLHGSDLLLHAAYLDWKLKQCAFCLTISDFNRRYILEHFPQIVPEKVLVQRLGVSTAPFAHPPDTNVVQLHPVLLTVGRLHPVKDHAFLLRACHELRGRGIRFCCRLAGDGLERGNLQRIIRELGLEKQVELIGHLSARELAEEYRRATLVVLTSRSEGIPVVLMEAMAAGVPVLAPRITGIPELVVHGVTGFLYQPGSLEDFVEQTLGILNSARLAGVTDAAAEHVRRHFDQETNLAQLVEVFRERLEPAEETSENANPILQQVQLSLQRD